MKGLYFFTKKIAQFSQSRPIFNRLGGKIITWGRFPITFFYFLFKTWLFGASIFGKKFKRLDKVAKGIILCQSGYYIVPPGQNFRRVFVYHGTCDKIYRDKKIGPDNKLLSEWFEYYFVTGEKDLDKLRRYIYNPETLEGKIVKIGMLRSDPIINKSYDKDKILKKYNIIPNDKKIILYAPTWKWGGGTLGRCFETFAREIPKKYVLIIRPHYNDRKNIKFILEWQRKNSIKNLYFFPKQHQDIMNFIYISDLFIGDNSSVNYDFAVTKRPMVLVKSDEHKDLFIPNDEYNIKLCCPIYEPESDDILEKIEDAFVNPVYRKNIERLVDKSFYFNDGHAVDRACSFIVDILSEMKIINKEKTLKKYKNRFVYLNNFR